MGFHTCGPNEAMIISGMGHTRPKLLPGGRVFVWPIIQKIQRISLRIMTVTVTSPKIYTKFGVAISVTGIAQVKIEGSKREMLHNACQQFLGKTENQVAHVAMETLEGHQRAIMGTMTVEEIYQDRKKFSHAVFEVATRDLVNMGINVVSYTIKDVSDEEGYLMALGQKRIAEVQRDATIGEAEARRDAGIRAARADQAEKAAKYENDGEIAKSQRDFSLKKAQYDIEVNTRKADSQLAYELQAAKTKQKIRNEQMGVLVVERAKQIQVQEQEIIRRERELEATVKKPAAAEKYRLETLAEGSKNRAVLEAEAEAETIKLRGEAHAFAIAAKATAEADAMAKKADAWKEYQDAAMVDMVLRTLPKVAAEIAAPLSKVGKVTMIAGPNGDVGASRLTGEVLDIMARLPATVRDMTGVDISKVLRRATSTA